MPDPQEKPIAPNVNEYLAAKEVPSHVRDSLEKTHNIDVPEVLANIEASVTAERLGYHKAFLEFLATYDIPEKSLREHLPECLEKTIEECETYLPHHPDEYLEELEGGQLRLAKQQNALTENTINYFRNLHASPQEEQVAWAQNLRKRYLEARKNVEADLQRIDIELQEISGIARQDSLQNKMATISRLEWTTLIPTLFGETFFSDEIDLDEDFETSVARALQEQQLLRMGGMRTFPNEQGESFGITVLETEISVKGDDVGIVLTTEKSLSAQRHEAWHLYDDLEIIQDEEDPDVMVVKMGFREDRMNTTTKTLISANEDAPRGAIEEGGAVYFQLKHDDAMQIHNTIDYQISYEVVSALIEHMGEENFLRARLAHDINPVMAALSELDTQGDMLRRLTHADKAINKFFDSELIQQ